MSRITFEDIYVLSHKVMENDCYSHFHYPEMLNRYDSNFIEFKVLPSSNKFLEVEQYLAKYHQKHEQNHLKFYFPENKKPTEELLRFLEEKKYDISYLELYAIEPCLFPIIQKNPEIEVTVVDSKNLGMFLQIKEEVDQPYGIDFVKENAVLAKNRINDDRFQHLLAFYKGIPVGFATIIIREDILEIEELFVRKNVRYKGIGSHLQQFIMHAFPEKRIILVADGEDTPKEMYAKQNYQYLGFKYEILLIC